LSSKQGILHRIPDIEVPSMKITEEYDIQKTIAEGCYAKILLAHHRPTNSTVVLKAIHTELTSLKEFVREFHYSYQLSHHPNILSCYQVKFQTKEYYLFAQEHAPYGDLAANVGSAGLLESSCKKIAEQLSSALGFMHLKGLVHRDLKLENILVFTLDFSRIKLCDFGATMREGTLVSKSCNTWISFLPPEILEIVRNEKFLCKASTDVWQFGIIIYICLTGSSPWESADWVRDGKYAAFMKFQKRETTKIPDNFRRFTPRFLRAFRRIFDHSEKERAKVTDIMKYIKDKWLDTKLSSSKSTSYIAQYAQQASDQDSVKYMNHKDGRFVSFEDRGKSQRQRLMSTFAVIDTPTAADDDTVKTRVWEWLQTSATKPDDLSENFSDMPNISAVQLNQRPLSPEAWFTMSGKVCQET
jgi:serine/threonine-protein kinase SBK